MATALPIIQISLPTPWPKVGAVHVYLIREDPVTLIDTGLGTPESREALLDGLKRNGIGLRDIKRVLLTHAHLDHFGLAGAIQEEAGAEVWMHPDEEGKAFLTPWWYEGRDAALMQCGVPASSKHGIDELWLLSRRWTHLIHEWRPIADGQRFACDSGVLEAVHLPGHALGHVGFWDAAGGTLVGGDHLLNGITPNPVMEPLAPGRTGGARHAPGRALTLGQFLSSLERVLGMPADQVLPGHGPVILEHRTLAESYIAKHEQRLASFAQRLEDAPTAFTLTQRIYPWVKGFDVFLALSEVVAHLDLLADRGQVLVEPDVGGDRFLPVG